MSEPTLFPLDNPVRDYAWGDTERLGKLFGLENPEGTPQAEIWMGAHPGAPSVALRGDTRQALNELVAASPEHTLGEASIRRFGEQLPFLFKVLNAGQPLSIQLHPSKALAESGFAREEAAGVPRDAPERNYVDANHKPELIYALTAFRALCGFRTLDAICADLSALNSAVLAQPLRELRHGADANALRAFCQWLLQLPQADVESMLGEALTGAAARDEAPFRELLSLHNYYPADRGVLFAILLNIVDLEPGESLFMAPGHLHSYLGGVGLEIMASSDNVIRGGLTPKHVDCPELLRLATFEALPPEGLLVKPQRSGAQLVYPTPVEDFSLALVELSSDGDDYSVSGAEIVFCVDGGATISQGQQTVALIPGAACFVCAAAAGYRLSGRGRVARATAGMRRG